LTYKTDRATIKDILKFYAPWSTYYENKTIHDSQIVVDVTKINKEVVMEKIFHDIIKNKVRRDMILYDYTESSDLDEYRYNAEREVIIYEYDRWLMQLNNLYQAVSRTYYNQLRTLNEIDYDMKMTIELNEAERLKKKNLYSAKK
jgi:hypothetical protein